MPRGLELNIEAIGFDKTADRIALIAYNMLHLEPAWEAVTPILQEGEQRAFNRLKGRYVLTGATLESLTREDAQDAIREEHAAEYLFGTSVPYAKYLRKGKKSAVLVVQPKAKRQASEVIMDHIMGAKA